MSTSDSQWKLEAAEASSSTTRHEKLATMYEEGEIRTFEKRI